MFDSPTLHKVQTYFGGHNTGTPALIAVLCDNALDGIGWMEDLGVVFQDKLGTATGALYQCSHYGVEADGIAYTKMFQERIADYGDQIRVLYRTPAKTILTDESGDHHDDQRHHAPHQMGTQRLDMFKKSHLVVG